MANAEHLARDLAKTAAERDAISVVSGADDVICIRAGGDQDGRHRIRIELWPACAVAKTPGINRGANTASKPVVAGVHIVQPFVIQHVHSGAQTAKKGRRWRVGEVALRVHLGHARKIEIATWGCRLGAGSHGLFADPDDGEAGRHHETLLRAGNGNIDAPVIHAEFQ